MYDMDMESEQIQLTTQEKLRIHIVREHKTTAKAAAALNMSRATLSGVMHGNPPTLTVAKKIEAEFGIEVNEWPALR